jgi:hypothetical protein
VSDLMMELPGTVSDSRGTFRAWVIADESGDGDWQGWLEFVLSDHDACAVYATPIETRQHDREHIEQWASGLSQVYAEGALARATFPHNPSPASQAEVAAAADRRRSHAMQHLALLRRRRVTRSHRSQLKADEHS